MTVQKLQRALKQLFGLPLNIIFWKWIFEGRYTLYLMLCPLQKSWREACRYTFKTEKVFWDMLFLGWCSQVWHRFLVVLQWVLWTLAWERVMAQEQQPLDSMSECGVRWDPSIQNSQKGLKFIAVVNKFCGSGSSFESTCKIISLSSREILIPSFRYVTKHLCLLLTEFNTFTWQ